MFDVFRHIPSRGDRGRRAAVDLVMCFVLCFSFLFSSKAHRLLQVIVRLALHTSLMVCLYLVTGNKIGKTLTRVTFSALNSYPQKGLYNGQDVLCYPQMGVQQYGVFFEVREYNSRLVRFTSL